MTPATHMLNGLPIVDRDYGKLLQWAAAGRTVEDMVALSPSWPDDGPALTETIIDALFCAAGADPWIRCGDEEGLSIEGRRTALRGRLASCSWLVPNTATAPRRWLVVGFFFRGEIDGEPGPDAILLEVLKINGRKPADLCASALLDLARLAPLALVVADGSDGVEGWFFCRAVEPSLLRRFMVEAIKRGAMDPIGDWDDPHLQEVPGQTAVAQWKHALKMLAEVKHWDALSPVMMPGGRRSDGVFQTVVFFNPEVVRA